MISELTIFRHSFKMLKPDKWTFLLWNCGGCLSFLGPSKYSIEECHDTASLIVSHKALSEITWATKAKKIESLKSRKKVTVTHHMITFLRHSTVFGQFLLHDRWVKYCCFSLFTFVGYFPKLCLHREHSTSFLPAALSCCTLVHLNRI